MAKAALEALSGFNLFGAKGSQSSVMHVIPDNIAQSNITLTSMLPRESNTKETDAALLSIVGYPAFAVDDPVLADKVRNDIITKLEGNCGLKRFLRDDKAQIIHYRARLDAVLVEQNVQKLLPELYFLAEDCVEQERLVHKCVYQTTTCHSCGRKVYIYSGVYSKMGCYVQVI
jgi:phosphorylase kinase alpha/beta subunit